MIYLQLFNLLKKCCQSALSSANGISAGFSEDSSLLEFVLDFLLFNQCQNFDVNVPKSRVDE